MTRRWLHLALLLSLGVNLGVLATLAIQRGGGEAALPMMEGAAPAEAPSAIEQDDLETAPEVAEPVAPRPAARPPEEPDAGVAETRPPAPVPETPTPETPPGSSGARVAADPGVAPRAATDRAPVPSGPPATDRQPPFPRGETDLPAGVGRRLEMIADRLGLEGPSRREFIGLQLRFFLATRFERQSLMGMQRELRAELGRPAPDRERVASLLRRIEESRRSLDRAMVETVLATRELLDPRQEREYLRFLSHLQPGGGDGGLGPRRETGVAPRSRRPPGSPSNRP